MGSEENVEDLFTTEQEARHSQTGEYQCIDITHAIWQSDTVGTTCAAIAVLGI